MMCSVACLLRCSTGSVSVNIDSSARPVTGALIGTGAAPPAGAAGAAGAAAGVVAVLEHAASRTALDSTAKPNTLVLAFMGRPRSCYSWKA